MIRILPNRGVVLGLQALPALTCFAALTFVAVAGTPVVIDLLEYHDAARFEGVVPGDGLGAGEIASCDVNGDGIADLVITATRGDGPSGTKPDVGEIYVVLGARRRWSGASNILDRAAVRIIGEDQLDASGSGGVCADVNADGYADIIGESPNADSSGNSRPQTGQAHIIFGAATLPPLIDLANPFGTVVFGAAPMDGVGDEPAAGDVKGDGTPDLLLDAAHATSRDGFNEQAGKVHVLFGRENWLCLAISPSPLSVSHLRRDQHTAPAVGVVSLTTTRSPLIVARCCTDSASSCPVSSRSSPEEMVSLDTCFDAWQPFISATARTVAGRVDHSLALAASIVIPRDPVAFRPARRARRYRTELWRRTGRSCAGWDRSLGNADWLPDPIPPHSEAAPSSRCLTCCPKRGYTGLRKSLSSRAGPP